MPGLSVAQIITELNRHKIAMGVEGGRLILSGNLAAVPDELINQIRDMKSVLMAYLTAPREYTGIMCKHRRANGHACGNIVTVQRPSGKLAWCQTCFFGYPDTDDSIVPNVEHAVLPLRAPSRERSREKPALYVASDLEHWLTNESWLWADKVAIDGKYFVRLTPAVLAWLRRQVAEAESACAKGTLPLEKFCAIVNAFCPIYKFAVCVGMARFQSNHATGRSNDLIPF